MRIDLREAVRPEAREALAGHGLRGTFAVLTAHNPFTQEGAPDDNARRAEALETRLEASGVRFTRVDGCSPDDEHCEVSVAIDMEREHAVALGREFKQSAIFWFGDAAFHLVGACEPFVGREERLPRVERFAPPDGVHRPG